MCIKMIFERLYGENSSHIHECQREYAWFKKNYPASSFVDAYFEAIIDGWDFHHPAAKNIIFFIVSIRHYSCVNKYYILKLLNRMYSDIDCEDHFYEYLHVLFIYGKFHSFKNVPYDEYIVLDKIVDIVAYFKKNHYEYVITYLFKKITDDFGLRVLINIFCDDNVALFYLWNSDPEDYLMFFELGVEKVIEVLKSMPYSHDYQLYKKISNYLTDDEIKIIGNWSSRFLPRDDNNVVEYIDKFVKPAEISLDSIIPIIPDHLLLDITSRKFKNELNVIYLDTDKKANFIVSTDIDFKINIENGHYMHFVIKNGLADKIEHDAYLLTRLSEEDIATYIETCKPVFSLINLLEICKYSEKKMLNLLTKMVCINQKIFISGLNNIKKMYMVCLWEFIEAYDNIFIDVPNDMNMSHIGPGQKPRPFQINVHYDDAFFVDYVKICGTEIILERKTQIKN